MSKGIILLSGGLDSSVTAYIAKKECKELNALFVEYGQRHIREWESSSKIAESLGVPLKTISVPISELVETSLTGQKAVPMGPSDGIPDTWVPQRNSVFLALAFAYAETLEADRVYIGVNHIDYSGYPDCRPEFIESAQITFNMASKRYVATGVKTRIMTPLLQLSKKEIIRVGFGLEVPFGLTWSCYQGGEKACGKCDSCSIRLRAFEAVGIQDPLEYEE